MKVGASMESYPAGEAESFREAVAIAAKARVDIVKVMTAALQSFRMRKKLKAARGATESATEITYVIKALAEATARVK